MILPENYRGTLTGRGLPAGLSMPTLTTAVNSADGVKKSWLPDGGLGKKNPGLATRRLSRESRIYRNAPDDYNIV